MATVAFDDPIKELEWQQTNLALGQPVDAEVLLQVARDAINRADEAEDSIKKTVADCEKEAMDAEEERDVALKRADELEAALATLMDVVDVIGEKMVDKKVAVKMGKELCEAVEKARKA